MSTAAITFEPQRGSSQAHDAYAWLGDGVSLHVTGLGRQDKVELSRCDVSTHLSFRLTATEARALGAELLAAAAAVDAARGVAVQPVEG